MYWNSKGFAATIIWIFCLDISVCLKNGFALSARELANKVKAKDARSDLTVADRDPPGPSAKDYSFRDQRDLEVIF